MLRGIRLSRNFGKEAAICAGMEAAGGRAVVVMDGDLQHPPLLVPEMVRLWRETDVDIVEAVKSSRGREPVAAKLGGRLFYRLLKRLSGFDLAGASDFKLMDRCVCQAYLRMGERALFFRGMVAWLGFKRATVYFDVARRVGGRSKWKFANLFGLATTGLTAFSSSALRVVNLLGAVFFLLAIVLGTRALWVYFKGGAASGITTVVILQLIIGSFLLFGLGVIGEYIARIYDEVKARPRYVVSETTASQGDR
ncbi:MAG: glycosyltransferase family 2 protein, partial [Phycisphaerae bacterium]|nr:glycosyltransferase family 2 protein [Phycisphaerae bacterium]